jgi:rod shape-determining protein MreC
VLVGVLLVLLNLPEAAERRLRSGLRETLAPVQGALAGLTDRAGDVWQAIRGFGDLAQENSIMASELVRLRGEVRDLQAQEQENVRLRAQLKYRQADPRDLVPAEVIGRDVSGWWQTIRLGKGYLDGVDLNMAVITPDGLIGKTIEVTPRTADVLLISDPGCRVAVKLQRTGTAGVMTGRGPGAWGYITCRLDFLDLDQVLRAGDRVVTSGLGGVFPKGLPVGYIDEVKVDKTGLAQTAKLMPSADLGRLDHVFVVAEAEDPVASWLRRRRDPEEARP